MSIASEITRLQGVKSDILTAIADKGVTVPVGSALDDCPGLIASIGYDVIGGKKYKTVVMPDGKEWLAENLDFKFCNIGGSGTPSTANAWYYDNNETTYGWNGYKCGLLYNWYAVKFLNDNRAELCPGWHVPTNDEWTTLVNAVGGISTAGPKLKAANVSWATSWGGTDDYGFGVLPAGNYDGNFYPVASAAFFWTATESDSRACRWIFASGATMGEDTDYKEYGNSVRLVKDAT
jgi:uncharacterized protein (TIGR02145 family)